MQVRAFTFLIRLLPVALLFLFPRESFCQSSADYDRGVRAFRSGDYATAADLFASAESASRGTTDALVYEAKSLIHLEKFAAGEEALKRFLVPHPDSSEALYLLAFILHRENKPSESLDVYTKAAKLSPPTADDLKIVALDYVLLNDYSDAIRWLERAVAMSPLNKDDWYYLGRAYFSNSQFEQARSAFERVLALDSHDAKAENNLGLIYESEAKLEDASAAYRNAIAWQEASLQPNEQPYLNLGSLLMGIDRTNEALPFLEKAVQLAPHNAICHLKLGTADLRLVRLTDARNELEQAAQIDPENAAIHYQLGRLYKRMNLMDRASREFARTEALQSRAAIGNQQTTPKP